jgi:hypothetical protein
MNGEYEKLIAECLAEMEAVPPMTAAERAYTERCLAAIDAWVHRSGTRDGIHPGHDRQRQPAGFSRLIDRVEQAAIATSGDAVARVLISSLAWKTAPSAMSVGRQVGSATS